MRIVWYGISDCNTDEECGVGYNDVVMMIMVLNVTAIDNCLMLSYIESNDNQFSILTGIWQE